MTCASRSSRRRKRAGDPHVGLFDPLGRGSFHLARRRGLPASAPAMSKTLFSLPTVCLVALFVIVPFGQAQQPGKKEAKAVWIYKYMPSAEEKDTRSETE